MCPHPQISHIFPILEALHPGVDCKWYPILGSYIGQVLVLMTGQNSNIEGTIRGATDNPPQSTTLAETLKELIFINY